MQILNFEHLLCRNDNSYLVARCVKLFYESSRIQRYKLLLHYEDLNMFKQRSKGKGYPKCIFEDIFQFISKTKDLGLKSEHSTGCSRHFSYGKHQQKW